MRSTVTLLFIFTMASSMSEQPASKTALLFGGNGFMGSETVQSLLDAGFQITCLSRGNWHWDSRNRVLAHVTHIACNRNHGLNRCEGFLELLKNRKQFDLVVDFSGYKPDVVEEATALLRGLAKAYVYISSDSIYEVSIPQEHGDASRASREEDGRRPLSQSEIEKLKKYDSYGHYKLACEEVLQAQATDGGIPYVILRLPDVIGQRDSTNRWWPHQLLIQFRDYIGRELTLSRRARNFESSYVYVRDVADLIVALYDHWDVAKNQIFNVAFDEPKTLESFLNAIGEDLGMGNFETNHNSDSTTFGMFPSVERGPIDASKLKKMLGWSPTPWKEAMKATVDFYSKALHEFPEERTEAVEMLLQYVVSSKNRKAFVEAVEKEAEIQKELHLGEKSSATHPDNTRSDL